MKKLTILSLILFASVSSLIAKNQIKETIASQDTIIGYFNFDQLREAPFDEWFETEYQNYTVDTAMLSSLNQQLLDNITITIVLGTWCSDSQRETPRFVKILEYLDFDLDQLTAIGVNRKKQALGTPVEELNIEYVPTIIFYKDNEEIGRIIESPAETLEFDMLNIILGN